MKRIIKIISMVISWSLLVYFMIAFYSLSSNPSNWPEDLRLLFILFGPLLSIIISGVEYIIYKEEKK